MATPFQNSVLTTTVTLPADYRAALITGIKWGSGPAGTSVTLTYSFPDTASQYINNYGSGGNASEWVAGWSQLNSQTMEGFELALSAFANVSGLAFIESPDTAGQVGEIRIAMSAEVDTTNLSAWAYSPSSTPEAGDVWLSPDTFGSGSVTPGSHNYYQLLHELGHALGLKHSYEGAFTLLTELDNTFLTIMSNIFTTSTDPVQQANLIPELYPETPMVLDIRALQYLYGANNSYNAGDTVYSFDDDGEYLRTLWDAGGIDTIDYSSSTTAALIDLREGTASTLGKPVTFIDTSTNEQSEVVDHHTVWIALGTAIENARGGSGNDALIGNDLGNLLAGNGGADLLAGGNGNDTFLFSQDGLASSAVHGGSVQRAGTGQSVNISDKWLSFDLYDGGSGLDTLLGTATNDAIFLDAGFEYPMLPGIEIIYTLQGNDFIDLTSTAFSPGNIIIYLGSGNDTVWSHDGDDTLYGEDGNDVMLGWNGNDYLEGGSGNDVLDGGAGNDVLNGGGGANTLIGGAGDDVYHLSGNMDILTELSGEGTDTVITTFSYTLLPHYENLDLVGDSSVDGYGNASDNFLRGNAGSNILYGLEGNDTLTGMAGDDILEGHGGEDHLTGGRGVDHLTGGDGNDTLDGGPAGDVMEGGAGNDVHLVNRGDGAGLLGSGTNEDRVIELANEGIDTVLSHVYSFVLTDNTENLVLAGSYAISGQGNALNNEIIGNARNNLLNGNDGNDLLQGLAGNDTLRGGTGNDVLNGGSGLDILWGGTGTDSFVFDNLAAADWIFDFTAGEKLLLSVSVFTGIGTIGNAIDAGVFIVGSNISPADANDHIVYNLFTGGLYYDPDGNGAAPMVPFVFFAGSPLLGSSDLLVVA